MNAGAHASEIGDVVQTVTVFRMDEARVETMGRSDLAFSYRTSGVPAGVVVIGAALRLSAGDDAAIRSLMEEARSWRRMTQPLAEPNCGSVFTNPSGEHAAKLIEDAGGKTLSVGAAAVSQKHANFIVANPGATASDVRALIARIQELVLAETGLALETEVRFVGGPPGAR
jgi:UDP-N-acetylmuramate dehydrogenase